MHIYINLFIHIHEHFLQLSPQHGRHLALELKFLPLDAIIVKGGGGRAFEDDLGVWV